MAERRATNKYYPPDWDPSKGSINTYVGQHPLRDRARKLDQGILVVRKLAYFSRISAKDLNFLSIFGVKAAGTMSAWVSVRYNAEKKKIGNYYSTPIFEFSMKCHLCSSKIVIHTDPKNTEYVIISGARKREEDYKPEDAGVIALQDEAEAEKLAADPFYKLEHDRGDEQKAEDARPVITQLREHNDKFWKDPYEASRMIRKRFRDEKKVREADQKVGDAIRDKHNLLLDIVPATAEDDAAAKRIKWVPEPDSVEVKKQRVQSTRIFSSPSSSSKLLTPATPTFRTPSLKHKILSSQRGRGDP
ncbi:hypothetical protein HK097_006577, partial [Rhizophlyctis rosea]